MSDRPLDAYKSYVAGKLAKLTPIFAKASIGDFSDTIELPDEDDEFTELFVGVQVMLEVIRDQLDELRDLNRSLEDKAVRRAAALNEAQALAHIGSWEWDLQAREIHWSDELYRIFDVDVSERPIRYERYLDRIHPDDRDYFQETVSAALRDRRTFAMEHRVIRSGGEIRVIQTRGDVIVDPAGRPVRMHGTGQDITERKRFESALLESEARYRVLVETARDIIFTVSSREVITSLNPAFEDITGWPRSSWIGKPFDTLLHEEDRQPAREWFLNVLSGEILPAREWRFMTKYGEFVWGDVTSSRQIRQGDVVGILGIVRDITDRKAAERRLQMLAQTTTNMNESVVVADLERSMIFVNPAFLRTYGYTEDDLIGKDVAIMTRGEDREYFLDVVLGAALAGGWRGEIPNVRKNGEAFPALLSTSAIRDRHGKPSAIIAIVRDMSEQKELQRKLDEISRQRMIDLRTFTTEVQETQEEERRRIARELHDDLGQKLSELKLVMEVFEDEAPGRSPKVRAKLKQFEQQIDSLIDSVRRISSDLHPTALDDFGLVIALQLLCREFEKIHRISTSFHTHDVNASRYDHRIEIEFYRIAQEALANVAKHSRASRASVTLTGGAEKLSLVVEDDGAGFDPQATAPKGPDHGFGLISMHERAARLGGSWHVESRAGEGTKIRVEMGLR
jgi:PAS domain S-box-containing protein